MGWGWVIDDAVVYDAISNVRVGDNGLNGLVKITTREEKRDCNC